MRGRTQAQAQVAGPPTKRILSLGPSTKPILSLDPESLELRLKRGNTSNLVEERYC